MERDEESWSCVLRLLSYLGRIVLRSSLQEWCGVKLSRCEVWAQAVGEIHFLRLHGDDRETGRPCARQAVSNSRWQPQSEELASNDNVFEEVIAGDNRAKHLFVAAMWNTLYNFLLDRTLSAAICLQCNIYQWQRFAKNVPSVCERRSFTSICSAWQYCLITFIYCSHQTRKHSWLHKIRFISKTKSS